MFVRNGINIMVFFFRFNDIFLNVVDFLCDLISDINIYVFFLCLL